jgi:hypothetical protein
MLVCTTGFALEVAGTLVIDLDAATLVVGAFAPWTNNGTAGGTFAVAATSPEPANITVATQEKGLNGPQNVVYANNLGVDNRRPCNALTWSLATGDLFGATISSFSVELWQYDTAFTGYEALMGFGNRDAGEWMSFWTGGTGPGGRFWYGSGTPNSDFLPAVNARRDPTGGTFNLYTFVYDIAGGMECYINGKPAVDSAAGPNLNLTAGAPVNLFGYGRVTNVGGGMTGGIAKVRVHTDTLTSDQVEANYLEELPDYGLAYEVAGTLVIDLDAADLVAGATFTPWTNNGTAGGTFAVDATSPEPANITVATQEKGLNGPQNVVYANNLGTDNRRPCNALTWSLATENLFGATSDFSVEIWQYDTAFTGYEALMGFGNRDAGQWMSFWTGGAGPGGRFWYGSGTPNSNFLPAGTRRQDPTGGAFNLYTFVYDIAGSMKCYINGAQTNDNAAGPNLNLTSGAPVNLFGYGRVTNVGGGMTGGIAKVRIHTDQLTSTQVNSNYENERDDYLLPSGNLALLVPDPASIDFGLIGSATSSLEVVTIKNTNATYDLRLLSVASDNPVFENDLADLSDLTPLEERSFNVWTVGTGFEETGILSIVSDNETVEVDLAVNLGVFPPTTIYVDDDGSDITGDGSELNPYATIGKAVSVALSGATVIVKPGVYAGFTNPGIVMAVEADPIGAATINIVLDRITNTADGCDLTLRGFNINGVASPTGDRLIFSNKTLVVDQCDLTRDGNCIEHWDGDLTISDSTIVSGGLPDNYADAECWLGGSAGVATITNSSFSGAAREIFNIWGFFAGGDLTVENCYFTQTACNGNSLNMWGADTLGNATVINNVFDYSCAWGSAINLAAVDGTVNVYHNTVVYNNAIASSGNIGIALWDSSGTKEIINNIAVGAAEDIGAFNGEGTETVSNNWTTADGDPEFVSPAAYDPATYVSGTGDFHLRYRSVCSGGAVDIGILTDIEGNPRPMPVGDTPDIGAYEEQNHNTDVTIWNMY